MRKYLFVLLLLAICVPVKGAGDQSSRKKQGSCPKLFEEVLGQGHLNKYAESYVRDFVAHGENHEYALEEDMATAKDERNALPDRPVNHILAEQHLVAMYWTSSCTNTQAGNGYSGNGQEDQN